MTFYLLCRIYTATTITTMAKLENMCKKSMFTITAVMLSLVVLIVCFKKIQITEGMTSEVSQVNSGTTQVNNSTSEAGQTTQYSAPGNSQPQYSMIQGNGNPNSKNYFAEESEIAQLKTEIQNMEISSTSGYSPELLELRKQLMNITKKYDAAHASSIKSAADTGLAMQKYQTYKGYYTTYQNQPTTETESNLKASGKSLALAKALAIASAKESQSEQTELINKAKMQINKVNSDLASKNEVLKGLITSSQKSNHESEYNILGKYADVTRIYQYIAAGRANEEVSRLNELNTIPVRASQSTLMDRMIRGSNVGTMMKEVSLGNDDNVSLFRMGQTNSYLLVDTDNYGPTSTNFQQNPSQTIGPQSLGLGNMNVNVKMTHKLSPELNSQINQGMTMVNQTIN